jgi:guanine deaminase
VIGAHGLELLEWLERVVFPAEHRWRDPSHARAATQRAIDQFFAHGTTSICAFATIHHEGARAAIEVCHERGIRALVGQVLMDQEAPASLTRPAEALLDETAALLDEFGASGRVGVAVTPRFAISCSEPLLRGAGRLARETEASVQTHLAETPDECDRVRRLHGRSYVEVYRDAGLLTPRALHAHGIHLSDQERTVVAEHQAAVVHCPTSNSFLRSGALDRARLHDAGVRSALGSDVGGGYERSMVRVARAMLEVAGLVAPPPPSSAEAWWQITAGNADALGWAHSGRLEVGAEADVLVIRPDIAWREATDPLGALLFAWDDRWLDATLCNGRLVYRARNATSSST